MLKKVLFVTMVLSCSMSISAMAGTWQAGTGADQGKWWYDNGNGSYANNGWQWIDGNGDGTAECYYFDNMGWLLTNTTTPDGYTVNADGAWVENGRVQEKANAIEIAPISESDFVVAGNNSVTTNTADHSILTNWELMGQSAYPITYHVFITGDAVTTARGITFGNSMADVTEKYGEAVPRSYSNTSDRWYQLMVNAGYADANTITTSSTVIEYRKAPYGICFYFNQQDTLIGIVYYKDITMTEITDNATGIYDGSYQYIQSKAYYRNAPDQEYQLFRETPIWNGASYDEALEARYQLGQMADFSFDAVIKDSSQNGFSIYYPAIADTEEDIKHFTKKENNYYMDWYAWAGQRYSTTDESMYIELDNNTLTMVEYFTYPEVDEDNPAYSMSGKEMILKTIYTK